MERNMMKRKQLLWITAALSSSLLLSTTYAAQLVDVSKQPINAIKSQFQTNKVDQLVLLNEHTDFNGTKHSRLQQTYLGYPVFGADIVIHAATNTTMNGTLYQQLQKDLLVA